MPDHTDAESILHRRVTKRALGRLVGLATLSSIGAAVLVNCAPAAAPSPTAAPAKPTEAPKPAATTAPAAASPTTAAAAKPTEKPAAGPTPTLAPAKSTGPITVTYSEWEITDAQLKCHQDVVKAFNQDSANVKVEFQEVQLEKLKTQMAAGTAADVVHPDDDFAIGGAAKLVDLDPYIKQEKEIMSHHVAPQVIDAYHPKGKVTAWGRALHASPMIFYNKQIFDQAKVPYPTDYMTWEQYEEIVLKTTKKDGNRITIWGTRDSVQFIDALAATNGLKNGGWSLDGQTLLFGDPAYREAANYLFSFLIKHKVAADATTYKEMGGHWQMFQTGKLATSMSLTWVLAPFKEIKAFQWDAVKPQKRKEQAAVLDSYALSLTTSAKNPDLAWQFLAYYGTQKGGEIVGRYEYGIPLWKELLPTLKGPLGASAQLAAESGRIVARRYAHTNEFLNKEVLPRWDLCRNSQLTVDKAIDEMVAAWPKYQAMA